MDIPIDAPVECADGQYGHTIAIILNPVDDHVSHLIVREPSLLGFDRMVSVELVTGSTPDLVRLRCTKHELAHMPPFVAASYLAAAPNFRPEYGIGVVLWPYISAQPWSGSQFTNTPPGEVALQRGAHVQATDGQIGAVEEFLVSPLTNAVTHLILRAGPLWNRQDVTIPIAQIDHIDDDRVYLKLTKQQIAELPTFAADRVAV